MKLNLGCGKRKLDGYVNVDISGNPDIKSDLRSLPFEDNYADEILSVHVIEHFYAWEAPSLLKEWLRVLKPKGKMILECPDIDKAVKLYLENKESNQMFWWPLYGDPRYKDPYMMHKNGFTPERLIDMMKSTGLRNVKEKPAQFKLKELRDLRVVGYK